MRPLLLKLASIPLGLSIALLTGVSVNAAELDGFDIKTQDKSVTITLFTDEDVSYHTQQIDRQFSIILDHTTLSASQLKQGLPVVIDNRNLFIGRAVTAGNNQVKVILPNLSSQDFKVTVNQKHTEKTADNSKALPEKISPAQYAQKRISLNPIQKPDLQTPVVETHPERPHILKQASRPEKIALRIPVSQPETHTSSSIKRPSGQTQTQEHAETSRPGTIWNPYVVSKNEPEKTKSTESNNISFLDMLPYSPLFQEKNALSVKQKTNTLNDTPSAPSDPLWYLKKPLPKELSLPAIETLNNAIFSEGSTLTPHPQQGTDQVDKEKKSDSNTSRQAEPDIKAWINSLPQWLLITIALFLGGIGIFTLIGGLVLLKMLFQQGKTFLLESRRPVRNGKPTEANQRSGSFAKGKSLYATIPKLTFEDKAHYRSIEYLCGNTKTVAEAIKHIQSRQNKRHRFLTKIR